jgi:CDP-6-deoxy-D-xylo-4-hexulose-3-dehydrase
MIPLVKDTISNEELDTLADWLRTHPKLTQGNLTIDYEREWCDYLGNKYCVSVNSGSSAVMMMLQALLEKGTLNKGDSVIVPAVSWATDLAPVVQLGLTPVLCDCNNKDLSLDLHHFEELLNQSGPNNHDIKCVVLVSVLGLIPEMDIIVNMCKNYEVILLEDACESFGSSYGGRKLGTVGEMSCFSTYFGHHISTIEGGIISTNDSHLYNILKAIRSHGWERDVDPEFRIDKEDTFDSLYRFHYMGFNFRSTDLQAFLGINQLKTSDEIVRIRNDNYNLYRELIDNPFWNPPKSTHSKFISNFAYPVISHNRSKIVSKLIENDIETRPLICGSLGRQPFWIKRYGEIHLPNADKVNDYGFYLPNNHNLTEEEIRTVSSIVMEHI